MATYKGTLNIQVTDVNGDSATMRIVFAQLDTGTVASIASSLGNTATAVAALTNGKVTGQSFTIEVDRAQISGATAPPPANATYPSVTDGARLSFANSAGGRRVVVIPAPLLADFITGTNTVDPATPDMATFISLIEGLTDLDGSTNLYEGGVKVGKHARRRPTRKTIA